MKTSMCRLLWLADDSIMSEEQAAKRHTDSWTSKGLFIICIH